MDYPVCGPFIHVNNVRRCSTEVNPHVSVVVLGQGDEFSVHHLHLVVTVTYLLNVEAPGQDEPLEQPLEPWRVPHHAVAIVGYREVVDGAGVRYEHCEITGHSGRTTEPEVVG